MEQERRIGIVYSEGSLFMCWFYKCSGNVETAVKRRRFLGPDEGKRFTEGVQSKGEEEIMFRLRSFVDVCCLAVMRRQR